MPTFAAVAYEGPARSLVGALKFHGARGAAGAMAAVIVAGAPPGLLAWVALVPVPAAHGGVRRRGYDQGEVLAAALAARTGARVHRLIGRSGGRGTQVGRGRGERAHAARGSLRADPAAARAGPLVLVDDVVTTGATLAAAAAALRNVGAAPAAAVAYARTPGR